MVSENDKINLKLEKNIIRIEILLLILFVVIFSGCSLTLSSLTMIDNATSPDYTLLEHLDLNQLKRNNNVTIFLVNGDSLNGKYLKVRNYENAPSRNEINVPNEIKGFDSSGILMEYQNNQKFVPLERIKEIKIIYEKRKVWISFLTGLIIDSIFIYGAYITAGVPST